MLQRLRRFMIGRYGIDQLNLVMFGCGIVCSLCGAIFSRWFYLPGDALYLYALFRCLSRNTAARGRENLAFQKVLFPVKNRFSQTKRRLAQSKDYKYFRCPNCRQQLRAPRGRGKVVVTCQNCRHVFQTKT